MNKNMNVEKFATLQTIIEQTDFDRYVINLPKNKERLEAITQIYNNSDLSVVPFIRFEAVNGKEIDVKPFVSERVNDGIVALDTTGERLYHSQITRGMVGCYLSHLEIYKKIQQSSKPYALILEDDAFFDSDIYQKGIRNLLQTIPPDWDIIMLGRMTFDPSHEVIDHESYLELRKFWGTYGYLINQTGANKMLTYANIPIDDQIDAVMGKLSRENILNIYAPLPEYIKMNRTYGSEVQQNVTNKDGVNPNIDPYVK
jgi:GR25 family glycosyltransferase involved in LPS biosynthesis